MQAFGAGYAKSASSAIGPWEGKAKISNAELCASTAEAKTQSGEIIDGLTNWGKLIHVTKDYPFHIREIAIALCKLQQVFFP
jgi:hypothetical protein